MNMAGIHPGLADLASVMGWKISREPGERKMQTSRGETRIWLGWRRGMKYTKASEISKSNFKLQRKALSRRTSRAASPGTSSCSQMRRTRQPHRRRVRFTSRSRARLRSSFRRQNARLPLGIRPCFGQPCQKQPSTKTAKRAARKTKSGLPNRGCRRQPARR